MDRIDKKKRHPYNFVDISGQTINGIYIIEWDYNPPENVSVKKENSGAWKCRCSCGNLFWGSSNEIKSGRKKGCKICREVSRRKRKKTIKYDLSNEYGIGYTYNTNKPFYFDLEDYDKIKKFSWKENSNGYAQAVDNCKCILMHRIVLGVTDSKIHIDHRYHNKLDNRKQNLRETSCKNNTRNKSMLKSNTSGVTGVSWENKSNKWHAYIWVDGKTIHLGRFINFEDAVRTRKEAEEKYFGEYSYDNSMKYTSEKRGDTA